MAVDGDDNDVMDPGSESDSDSEFENEEESSGDVSFYI